MLHLEQNKTNTLTLVTDDVKSIASPIYLWRFRNDQTTTNNNEAGKLVELINELPDNPRADRFTLTLPTDLDLNTGDFHYFVYQSDTTGRTDFENMPLLATGRAEVKTEFQADTAYEQTGTDTVYKGNEA